MIYEIPRVVGNTFWNKTKFKILNVDPGANPGEWARYRVKVIVGNGRSKRGEEVTFVYPYPHDFILAKGNILNA